MRVPRPNPTGLPLGAAPRRVLELLMRGPRLPITKGTLEVEGVRSGITIRRDRWGIPHVRARSTEDAWFGLGFCQGQDRTFQLEMLRRLATGTLAAMIGEDGVSMDRLTRRLGLAAKAPQLLAAQTPEARAGLAAFAQGVTQGSTVGRERRPPSFVLARAHPTAWTAEDVVALLGIHSFLLASNWDLELTRLKILELDGPEALEALDPGYAEWLPVIDQSAAQAGPALDRLLHDVEIFRQTAGPGGASNNWVLGGKRTATGRPQVANDPHLPPFLPPHWYLCHLQTPKWAVAGASFAGVPGIPSGHNGHGAWGVTAAHADNVDLFVHEVSADREHVRIGEEWVKCEVRSEIIEVRDGRDVLERVLETPHGPVIGPALEGEPGAVSIRATWLDPQPVRGLMEIQLGTNWKETREILSQWPAMPLGLVYADAEGSIGYQLVGTIPVRKKGGGYLPLPASDPDVGWTGDLVPHGRLPTATDPDTGFLCTANNRPTVADGYGDEEHFLGVDWLDGYRAAAIEARLGARDDWDVHDSLALQTDVASLPWEEMKPRVLAALAGRKEVARAHELLEAWDGVAGPRSSAASLFELFVAEMCARLARAKAPRSWEWALGRGFTSVVPHSLVAIRRVSHLVRLLREEPEGWFAHGWTEEMVNAMSTVVARLRREFGTDPKGWYWGTIRPLELVHPLADAVPALRPFFNLGPFPWMGDSNTVAQASVPPTDPLSNPMAIGSLRMVVDVGAWGRSRFALPGGQSGNPLSPHYDDQVPVWLRGNGVPIAWTDGEVDAATVETLRLVPR